MVIFMKTLKNVLLAKASLYGLALSSVLVASSAQAAITAEDLAPIATSIGNDLGVILIFAFGLLALIIGPVIGFKLVKRFTTTAT
jgi:hypothetical protein